MRESKLNMGYEVILTDLALAQLDNIIAYLLHELKSMQAANSVLQDADETSLRISRLAGSLKLCEDDQLQKLGYRTIHFKHHRYFMVYRIERNRVYVDGIYHDLQDYENILK